MSDGTEQIINAIADLSTEGVNNKTDNENLNCSNGIDSEVINEVPPDIHSPRKPEESECCNTGCNPCILDAYEEQKRKYEEYLRGVREICTAIFQRKNCIFPTEYSVFKLTQRLKHTENSFLLTFQFVRLLENDQSCRRFLSYRPGQHFMLKEDDGSVIQRAYTPIPLNDDDTSFTILVKFYQNGRMSEIIRNYKVGREVLFRGPYFDFNINKKLRYMLLIAQGTGIAPLYAVTKEILFDYDCETFVHLFLCCRGKDVYLRREIYRLKESWNFRYEIFLTNSTVEPWYTETMHKRRLEFEDIERYLTNKDDVQVLISGSDEFEKNLKKQVLDCGVEEEKIFLFE